MLKFNFLLLFFIYTNVYAFDNYDAPYQFHNYQTETNLLFFQELKPKEFITRLKLLDEKIDQFYLPKLKTIKEKTKKYNYYSCSYEYNIASELSLLLIYNQLDYTEDYFQFLKEKMHRIYQKNKALEINCY